MNGSFSASGMHVSYRVQVPNTLYSIPIAIGTETACKAGSVGDVAKQTKVLWCERTVREIIPYFLLLDMYSSNQLIPCILRESICSPVNLILWNWPKYMMIFDSCSIRIPFFHPFYTDTPGNGAPSLEEFTLPDTLIFCAFNRLQNIKALNKRRLPFRRQVMRRTFHIARIIKK